jgi:hypothetical protein
MISMKFNREKINMKKINDILGKIKLKPKIK